jgi:hypothetical protein
VTALLPGRSAWGSASGSCCPAARSSRPTHGIYELVGVIVIIVALLTWGFENFAITAGTDLMPAEGFIWWRAFFELIIANVLMFAFFPVARTMAGKVWTDLAQTMPAFFRAAYHLG